MDANGPCGLFGGTAVMQAVACGSTRCAQALLHVAGVDADFVDADGSSARSIAAVRGRSRCVRALLEAGAGDVDFECTFNGAPVLGALRHIGAGGGDHEGCARLLAFTKHTDLH